MAEVNQYKKSKSLVLTVTNDLVTDNRVHKIATTLVDMGFDVTLVGRLLKNSLPVENRNYTTHRMRLWFTKGPLFYANYNICLAFFLLRKKYDVIVANDLDSLLACYVASEMTNKELVYDSHEYFTEVPELVNRPKVKRSWEKIEEAIVPKLKHCYTVCQSISTIYNNKYGTNFRVVRNLPFRKREEKTEVKPPFPTDLPIIIYQGSINYGRSVDDAIIAMHKIDNARLIIIGEGDEYEYCKQLVKKENLSNKVIMTGRIPFNELRNYTQFATIGLSIEKDIGLNYRYALPNKIFDYIQNIVPILSSELPEIKAVVTNYNVGKTIPETTADNIANTVNEMLSSPELLEKWQTNCKIAAEELCWENEQEIVRDIYRPLLYQFEF